MSVTVLIAAWSAAMIVVAAPPAVSLARFPSRFGASASPALTHAAFVARADAICQAGSELLTAQRGALDAALGSYEANDTYSTRAALSGALAKFFFTDYIQLWRVARLHAPIADRTPLTSYLIGSTIVVATAKPFIAAVQDDDATLVAGYASAIAATTAAANASAQRYGFFICGSGRTHPYTVHLRLPGTRRIVVGTTVALSAGRGARAVAGAGEVVSVTRSGGFTDAEAVLRPADAPLRSGSVVSAVGSGRGLYLSVVDGPAGSPPVASGGTLTGGAR
jgi:hypothetical protein